MVAPPTAAAGRVRTRARRGEGAKLRKEILDAATRLLVETGDEGLVSVRAVADRVGVTPPSIYLHFGDKNELIFECCRALMGQLQVEVLDAVVGIDDPVERLRVAAHCYVRFGMANPEPYRIMFMSPHHDLPADFDIAEYEGAAAFASLVAMVTDVVGPPGPVPGDDVDPDLVAMGLWSTFHGVTSLMIAKSVEPIAFPWPDVERLVDHLIDVHLAPLNRTTDAAERTDG